MLKVNRLMIGADGKTSIECTLGGPRSNSISPICRGAGLPSDTDAAARWTGRPKDPAERTDKYPILTFSLIANKCSF